MIEKEIKLFFLSEISVYLKVQVMQIEKALVNNRLRDSKVSWKFFITTIYNFAVIHP